MVWSTELWIKNTSSDEDDVSNDDKIDEDDEIQEIDYIFTDEVDHKTCSEKPT